MYFSGPGGRTGRTFLQKVRINVQGGQSASQGIALLRASSDGIAWTFMRTLPQKVHTISQRRAVVNATRNRASQALRPVTFERSLSSLPPQRAYPGEPAATYKLAHGFRTAGALFHTPHWHENLLLNLPVRDWPTLNPLVAPNAGEKNGT